MSVQLQQFEHDRSSYDRPDQAWVCGHSADGRACRQGPDTRGGCATTSECRPVRKGDRWHCTRPPGFGGRCDAGPLPDGCCGCPVAACLPVRAHRSQRGRLSALVAALTIGVLLVLTAGPWQRWFVSSGPLSMNHAQLDDRCDACHSAARGGLAGFVSAALSPPSQLTEASHCLDCHQLGASPRRAHALPPRELAALVDANASPAPGARPEIARMLGGGPSGGDQIPCALCHVEHRGRLVDLTRMNASRCQSCHQQRFDSFPGGHSEFSATYPARRRTRIAFNHQTHWMDYFRDTRYSDVAPTDCGACHVPDATGDHMLVKPFESSCGSCHQHLDQIATGPIVPVFGLPAVDVDALTQHGIWIGDTPWPVDAGVGDEIELTPIMRLLLGTDLQCGEDLATVDAHDGGLMDLSDADEEVIDAAGRLMWAVMDLVANLCADDAEEYIAERMNTAVQRELMPRRVEALLGQPLDAPHSEQQNWQSNVQQLCRIFLPNLNNDLSSYRADPGMMHRPPPAPPVPTMPAALPPVEVDSDDDLLGDDPPEDDLLGDDDDLLGDDPPEDDLLGDDDDLLGDDDLLDAEEPQMPAGDERQAEIEAAIRERDSARSDLHALMEAIDTGGGWHLDEGSFTVAYRPTGHADPFVHAWIDVTAADGRPPARNVFAALTDDPSPGRCTKCHSIEATTVGPRIVHQVSWRADAPSFGTRGFTRFSHRPHFNFRRFRDCTSCHAVAAIGMDSVRRWKESYHGTDSSIYEPTLGAISKSLCTDCHTPDGAGDSCLACHNYHVGTIQLRLSPPDLGE